MDRPLSILIAALGGEGGGVLAEWIVAASSSLGLPVQSSSIPGVAQRTGATTYYVEIARTAVRPTMTLAPAPGQVDVLVASELLEAGRAMLNGFVSPQRTTLIASTHRAFTVAEKMQMGDGRFDPRRIVAAADKLAKARVLADMQAIAREAGAMVNAVLFGALAASGATPLTREACERAIREGGKGVEASLKGFAAGFELASKSRPVGDVPREVHDFVELGRQRVRSYQDQRYEALYLERLNAVKARDGGDYALTRETARFLALWMCYEDVIRVADLKSRRSRFERVRAEARAKPHEPVHVIEYFKPRAEEIAAILPPFLARLLPSRGTGFGLHLKTTGVAGFLMLRTLAALRPLRRMSSRFPEEQTLIGRWLSAIKAAPPELAMEIALCARLIKGYGDTHQRGKGNFLRILEGLVERGNASPAVVREAREAALKDAEGVALDKALATQGIEPRPTQAKPLKFIRRPTEEREAA
jgi:indolepyruvate ferredoxin oxidoreductase beta subunit